MTRLTRSILATGVLAAVLSACSDNNVTTTPTTPPVVTPTVRLEDQFGAGFGTRFRADANTRATDPLAADLGPVSITTDPVTI